MPQSFAAANINFEQAVKNIVRASFPTAHPDISIRKTLDGTAASTASSATLNDPATGNRIFTFGISRWGGSRAVGA